MSYETYAADIMKKWPPSEGFREITPEDTDEPRMAYDRVNGREIVIEPSHYDEHIIIDRRENSTEHAHPCWYVVKGDEP